MKPSELAKLADCKPQMVYNYISHGYIKAERDDEGRWAIDDEYGAQWAAEHKAKRTEREERKQALIEAQLRGEA